MANDKTTITVSRIDLPLNGFPKTLEQITSFEANRRGLVSTKAPVIFRRERGVMGSEVSPFQITAEDFRGARERNYNLVVPDNAVAYVVGEDSGTVNTHVGIYDNKGSNDVYIPVQFYKEREEENK